MFILTSINLNMRPATVKVLDTDDRSNDPVDLLTLSKQILNGNIKVYGLSKYSGRMLPDTQYLPEYNLVFDIKEALEAMARFYMEIGMSKEEAYTKAGLRSK